MKMEIQDRLLRNLERVDGLLGLYRTLGGGQGRRAIGTGDLLRSAVVFLHATLEEVLRSCLEWRWPEAGDDHFVDIPFAGGKATRITLGQLAAQREKTVRLVLEEAIRAYLARSNFNNLGEIRKALVRIGADADFLGAYAPHLETMMRRRHHIVHRADRNEMRGRGQHAALSIAEGDVTTWRESVRGFSRDLLARIESRYA